MAGITLTMNQIRLVIRLLGEGLSQRKIAKQLGISRNTIRSYKQTLDRLGLSPQQAYALEEASLSALLFQQDHAPVTSERSRLLEEQLPALSKDLIHRHVTRQLLWEEYRQSHPDGYGYTQFCQRLNHYIERQDVTMVLFHQPGDVLEIDFAGDKLHYIDANTGEVVRCEVFLATLAYSKHTYVEALPNQSLGEFIPALANALRYFGGVPASIKCDNMRTAVKRSNRYEPTFTDALTQLSLHYGTTLTAARVRKPRDKPSVEGSVNAVYKQIYARLRNEQVFSVSELNAAIRTHLDRFAQRPFKGRNYSRQELFEQEEKSLLSPLPMEHFSLKQVVQAKVQINYHVTLGQDMHLYSVPYRYARKQTRIVYDQHQVEIYCGHERIAIHQRNRTRHTYTTLREHMPPNHQAIHDLRGMTPDDFLVRARVIGPATEQVISRILSSRSFVEQTHNSCLGLLRLAKRYGQQNLEEACTEAVLLPKAGYRIVKGILDRGPIKRPAQDFKTPEHANIRGAQSYH